MPNWRGRPSLMPARNSCPLVLIDWLSELGGKNHGFIFKGFELKRIA